MSAKTGDNVDSLFQDVACDIYNKISVPMDNLSINLLQAKKKDDDDLNFIEKREAKPCCCKIF